MTLIRAWFRIPFWQRVLAGFVLGAIAGWLAGPAAETWFGPFGTLYVTLIRMIAVPLVFFAVITAVSSLQGQQSMASLGGRTFAMIARGLSVGMSAYEATFSAAGGMYRSGCSVAPAACC